MLRSNTGITLLLHLLLYFLFPQVQQRLRGFRRAAGPRLRRAIYGSGTCAMAAIAAGRLVNWSARAIYMYPCTRVGIPAV